MTKLRLLVLMTCVAALTVGCQTMASHCDGWKPALMKRATANYLARNDPAVLRAIVGHNEHGRDVCGWKR